MTTAIVRTIINIFKPNQGAMHLGRWALKHDEKACEKYIQNAHADPGYPNDMKSKWIEIRKEDDDKRENL